MLRMRGGDRVERPRGCSSYVGVRGEAGEGLDPATRIYVRFSEASAIGKAPAPLIRRFPRPCGASCLRYESFWLPVARERRLVRRHHAIPAGIPRGVEARVG